MFFLVLEFALILSAVLLAGGLAYQYLGTARDARRFPPPGRLVPLTDSGGPRLHLHGIGVSGPTVILDAGIGASSLSWSLVQSSAARFARVYAYDRAGYGWSNAPRRSSGPRIASRLAEELRALLRAADVPGPYILVGHSFGGYVARLYAERWPVEVAGLVMVDSPGATEWAHPNHDRRRQHIGGALFSRIGGHLARLGVVRFCLNRLGRGSKAVPVTVTRAFGPSALALVTRMVGQVMKYPPGLRRVAQAHWSCPGPFASLADHLAHLPESAQEVAACGSLGDLPFVVMTAANPSAARAAQQDAVACQSTRGRHIIAREGGHWLLLDQPELVVQAIESVVEAMRQPVTGDS
ncbi:MAG TPA: alpha/beta hydrolase [Candidatus Acidoferrales bacterium]|nr:alpha/beta hydrolase [Candidatus Acidoferrales bacterium]